MVDVEPCVSPSATEEVSDGCSERAGGLDPGTGVTVVWGACFTELCTRTGSPTATVDVEPCVSSSATEEASDGCSERAGGLDLGTGVTVWGPCFTELCTRTGGSTATVDVEPCVSSSATEEASDGCSERAGGLDLGTGVTVWGPCFTELCTRTGGSTATVDVEPCALSPGARRTHTSQYANRSKRDRITAPPTRSMLGRSPSFSSPVRAAPPALSGGEGDHSSSGRSGDGRNGGGNDGDTAGCRGTDGGVGDCEGGGGDGAGGG